MTRHGKRPDGAAFANEWEIDSIECLLGSTAKNVSNISAIAIDTIAQRYGWARGLSTAPAGYGENAEAVPKFIILPEFRVAKTAHLGECPPRLN